MTPDDNYSLLVRHNLFQHFQKQLSQKKRRFLNFCVHFRNPHWILKISKKIWPSKVIYFWTDLLRKMWLDKCLKSSVSEDPSTRNMANGPKHCWNLNSSTFVIFIDHCERNSVVKSLSWWYEKYKDCFLTHWLPMTSILFLIETIYRNIFRCNYLENNRNFHNFLFHLGNLDSTLNILKKKDDPHRWCIFELTDFEKCG